MKEAQVDTEIPQPLNVTGGEGRQVGHSSQTGKILEEERKG